MNGDRPDDKRCPWCQIGRHGDCQAGWFWCTCAAGDCLVRLLNDEEEDRGI